MLKTLILIAIGGGLGSVIRYLNVLWIQRIFPGIFPAGTFMVNLVGCLLIGLIIGALNRIPDPDSTLKYLLVVGFCGGYTTFSAFSYENVQLIQYGDYLTAFVYISASIILGMAFVLLGFYLGK